MNVTLSCWVIKLTETLPSKVFSSLKLRDVCLIFLYVFELWELMKISTYRFYWWCKMIFNTSEMESYWSKQLILKFHHACQSSRLKHSFSSLTNAIVHNTIIPTYFHSTCFYSFFLFPKKYFWRHLIFWISNFIYSIFHSKNSLYGNFGAKKTIKQNYE